MSAPERHINQTNRTVPKRYLNFACPVTPLDGSEVLIVVLMLVNFVVLARVSLDHMLLCKVLSCTLTHLTCVLDGDDVVVEVALAWYLSTQITTNHWDLIHFSNSLTA